MEDYYKMFMDSFEKDFYGIIPKWLLFVEPLLEEYQGDNELLCGSQYHHLSIMENGENTLFVFRYEQGKSTVFDVENTVINGERWSTKVKVYKLSINGLFLLRDEDVLFKVEWGKNGFTMVENPNHASMTDKLKILGEINQIVSGVVEKVPEEFIVDFSEMRGRLTPPESKNAQIVEKRIFG